MQATEGGGGGGEWVRAGFFDSPDMTTFSYKLQLAFVPYTMFSVHLHENVTQKHANSGL